MDVALADVLHDAVPFALPLTHRFRGIEVREGMLIRGPSGWGEFAPFDDYSAERAALWLAAAVEAAFGAWPEPLRERVPINAIIPAVSAAEAAELARRAVLERGCRTLKIKVAQAGEVLADDEARVASVRHAADSALHSLGVSDRAHLRLDANGAWEVEEAARALHRLAAYDLEYVEQPCRALVQIRQLREMVEVPIALDESIRFGEDGALDIADVVIVKAAPLGGVQAALTLVADWSGPVVVSGALDSAVGLSSGLALAGALPGEVRACGLGTGALLARDVVAQPRVPVDGMLEVGRVAPDLDALMAARSLLPADRASEWRQRLVDAWQAGGAERVAALAA